MGNQLGPDCNLESLLHSFEGSHSVDVALKIWRKITDKINFTPIIIEAGNKFHRIVKHTHLITNAKEVSYPPYNYAIAGRCNQKGQQLFYCSDLFEGAVAEMKGIKNGGRFFSGEWSNTAPIYCLYAGNFTEEKIHKIQKANLHAFKLTESFAVQAAMDK